MPEEMRVLPSCAGLRAFCTFLLHERNEILLLVRAAGTFRLQSGLRLSPPEYHAFHLPPLSLSLRLGGFAQCKDPLPFLQASTSRHGPSNGMLTRVTVKWHAHPCHSPGFCTDTSCSKPMGLELSSEEEEEEEECVGERLQASCPINPIGADPVPTFSRASA